MLEPVQATISVKGNPIDAVKVVDVHGVPIDATVSNAGNTFEIHGRYATYYYEVTRTGSTVAGSRRSSSTTRRAPA